MEVALALRPGQQASASTREGAAVVQSPTLFEATELVGEVDWDSAVRAHHRRVVVSIMALGVPIDRAEDIANQAWLKLFRDHKAGRLDQIKLPGLVIKQARFLALNALEKDKAELQRRLPVPDDHPAARARAQDAESRLLSREQLRRALSVLADKSDSARAVFRLVYGDPAPSHAEVARRVGISVQRVRQILCELRRQMREAMEEGP